MIDLALRPNQLKNRNLWDIGWLKQQNVKHPLEQMEKKTTDYQREVEEFIQLLEERNQQLIDTPQSKRIFILR